LIQGQVGEGLLALLGASEKEKEARGIRYTPLEILRQPSTWQRTSKICGTAARVEPVFKGDGHWVGSSVPTYCVSCGRRHVRLCWSSFDTLVAPAMGM